jgi:WD40 repeat protein
MSSAASYGARIVGRIFRPRGGSGVTSDSVYDAFMSYSHAADGLLAPRVQAGLQRLARPTFRPRAVRIFRDQTDLSATPGLWTTIERALDRSGHFILMASPQAAASPWVDREVEHWLTRSPAAREGHAAERLLIVLTEGEIHWDAAASDFDWSRSTALPRRLRGVFQEEPLHADLRELRSDEDLSLHNPRFRSSIADLAAPLHGRTKDELIGEDVRLARRTRRLAWSAVASLAILAAAAGTMAYIATVQRDAARSRELAAQAVAALDTDPATSLGHALAAVAVQGTPEAAAALREALVRSAARAVLVSSAGPIVAASFSPDGSRVLTEARAADGRRSLQLWDAATGALTCTIGGTTRSGGFAPEDGSVATRDGAVYDGHTCRPLRPPDAVHDTWAAAADDDRAMDRVMWYDVVVADSLGAVEVTNLGPGPPVLRDRRTGRIIRELAGDPVAGAVFRGELLLTWAAQIYTEGGGGPTELGDRTARLWDAGTGELHGDLAGHRRAVITAAFDRSADYVVTGSEDRTARVWVASSRQEFAVLRGHRGAVTAVAFSPNVARLLTVSDDGTARLWEPGTGTVQTLPIAERFRLRYGFPLPGIPGVDTILEVPELSTDGRALLARVDRSRLIVAEARTGLRLGELSVEYESLRGRLSPDGARAVTVTGDGRTSADGDDAEIRDVSSGRIVHRLSTDDPTYTADWSPDGSLIATAGESGVVILWNTRTVAPDHSLDVSDSRIMHVSFSGDSRRLVTASRDAIARIWDVRTGTLLLELFGHEGGVLYAAFTPDDALVVTVGDDGTRVWDATSGKHLGRFAGNGEPALAYVTPDCGRLVTGGREADRAVWVHEFGACGPVDRLREVALGRAPR